MNRDTLPVIIERDARALSGRFLQRKGFITPLEMSMLREAGSTREDLIE